MTTPEQSLLPPAAKSNICDGKVQEKKMVYNSAEGKSGDQNKYNMSMTTKRVKINLLLVSLTFLLNRSTYLCLEALQSSLNEGTGTISLATSYSTIIISSMFLPTLAMDFLKVRKTIAVALLCYAPYTLANCYPHPYTLIPSAIIMGCGASMFWSAGRVYISDLATAFAKMKGVCKDDTTSKFYGIFMGVVLCSCLVGNLVTSTVLSSVPDESVSENIVDNGSYIMETTTIDSPTTNVMTSQSKCGMYNCDWDTTDSNSTNNDVDADAASKNESLAALIPVFLGFAASQITAALIVLFGVKDVPDMSSEKDEKATICPQKNGRSEQSKDTNALDNRTDENCHEMEHLSNGNANEAVALAESIKTQTTCERIIEQASIPPPFIQSVNMKFLPFKALATGKFMIFSLRGNMLVPLITHIGFLQSFVLGRFTKHWVNCVLGLEYIGYATSVFGVGAIIGCTCSGFLAQHIGRQIVLGVTCLMELSVGIFLFIWDPDTNNDVWIFMATMAVIGLLYGSTKTIPPTLHSIFFPTKREAANAAGCIWDGFGSALAYAMSDLCNTTITAILLGLSSSGTLLYFGAERLYRKKLNMNKTESVKNEDIEYQA